MSYAAQLVALAAGLFLGMLALLELGRRIGVRRLDRDPEGARSGVALADGAVFALLGLLIAFSFSGAAERFQARLMLITDESNAIGTAWLRLALLPEDVQAPARESMRRYVDARLDVYRAIPDRERMLEAIERVSVRQTELWQIAAAARSGSEQGWEKLLFLALNEMFDIGTTRTHTMHWHPPNIVFVLLFALSLGCSWLAGAAMAGASHRPLGHMLAFALVVAVTVYIILDLEFPRQGLIRIDAADQALLDVRAAMR
ncbi:MAG: DUF4239 domain-containing protein [Planctomycetota bacterium]